jgi:hypothetical protein
MSHEKGPVKSQGKKAPVKSLKEKRAARRAKQLKKENEL